MKRILIIVASIIVLLGIGLFIYEKFFSGGSPTISVGNFFDTSGNAPSTGGGATGTQTGANAGTEVAPNLFRITDIPVADGTIALTVTVADPNAPDASGTSTASSTPSTSTDTAVRFADRASGNLYSFLAHARTMTRLSNRTLPGVARASWLSDGSAAIVQFLSRTGTNESVKSFVLPQNGTGGFFLDEGLSQAIAGPSRTLLSVLPSSTGTIGTLAAGDGTGVHQLFSTLLSEITVKPSNGGYFAYTNPSSSYPGYAFSISSSGALTSIAGPFTGLSVLPSPSGKLLLLSYVDSGTIRLSVMDVATRALTPLPVATLTEKCVWASDDSAVYCGVPTALSGNLPDDWYQGAVSFSDRLWRIDLAGRVATLIVDPNEVAKTSIDAVDLAIDPASDILVFTDKHSHALWMYNL